MGCLITKEYGPRVRLASVTTDLPLEVDHPIDLNVEHYCQLCRKCAINCPSAAIPFGGKIEVRRVLKWKIDEEKCYRFWRSNPMKWQDCARCVSVCPWNKPNISFHRMVAKLVARYKWTHTLINLLDDLLYGKKPKRKDEPDSFNDFLMNKEDFWQMINDLDVHDPQRKMNIGSKNGIRFRTSKR
jgi:ferredoxin